ncbi:PilN domain-containing protein [Neptunomonas sp.]|uniref:PilN domain-containing protein n=1 Tax=Neptunomonas sp. TaxID=1971898 RepID=UPI0025F7B2C6|nr:PilN domain-containing protein [Neptunomonas sp.]
MKQRINLLPLRPKVERDFLSLNSVMIGGGCLLLLCSFITGLLWFNTQQSEERLQVLLVKEKQLQGTIQSLATQQSQRKLDPELIAYHELLQQTVASKKSLSSLLETIQPESRKGFSEGLLAFSNSTPDKLWLTSFKMASGATVLDLSGESADTSQIPVFLRTLAQQEFFKNIKFAELETERNESDAYLFNAHGLVAGGEYE